MAEQSAQGAPTAQGAAPRAADQDQAARWAKRAARRSGRRRAWRTLRRARLGLVGMIILLIITLAAIAAPWVAPHDPYAGNLTRSRRCPAFTTCPNLGGSFARTGPTRGTMENLLGTDPNGRDVLSRIIYAARISLIVGVTAVAIGGSVGVLAGLITGYYGGAVDSIIMRLADVQLAFPFILLAIAIIAVLGGGMVNVIIVLGIGSWVPYARIVRGQVLSARSQEYVIAARTIGAHDYTVLFRHVLPNVITPVIIIATFGVAAAIIGEATLSYLGLGINAPTPTWGNMLADGRAYVASAWWLATFPGLAIVLTVLSINVIGDWLRDFLDPRLRHST
jgi:peptide/nickel transport system permease protein